LIRSSLSEGIVNDKNKTDDSVESPSDQNTEQNKTASLQSTAAAAALAPTLTPSNSIGWDPVKCRPIYHHDVVSSGSDANNNDDDDDDDDDASDESSDNGKMEDFFETAMPQQPHVQRIKRSYGSKKTPFSLFMNSDTVPFESSIGKKRRPVEQPSSSESNDLPASNTSTMEQESSLPRQVSQGLVEPSKDSNDKSQPPGISSKRRCRDKHKNKEQESSSTGNATTTKDSLDFAPDKPDDDKVLISKDHQLQQPSCNTSLLEARAFFERLDATQELKCDSSETPQVSSKAFRTSRNLHLSSPGISKEYQAYARASNESGVTPLSIKEYAVNRSGFFRRRDLFEGFLDG
jgi:hypothetical protein